MDGCLLAKRLRSISKRERERLKTNGEDEWERKAIEMTMKGCAAQMDCLAPKEDE